MMSTNCRCIWTILFLVTFTSTVTTVPNDDNVYCNEEVTDGFETNFIWPATNSSGFYTSQPQCFDDNSTLIRRQCLNNTWHPETIDYCTEINRSTEPKSPINTTNTVEAFLTFDRRRRDMYLMVYHPDSVRKLTCHTFGKKSIGVKLIFDSRIFNWGQSSYTVHKLDLEDLPNVYWCKILQRDWKTVQTEDVVGFGENYSNEYAVRVTIRPNDGRNYEELLKSSSKIFDDVCEALEVDCRLMEVFKVDVKRRKTELLYHLTSNRRKETISESYEFTNRIKYYHPSVISLEYLRSSDYCLPEKTMELYFSLTPIGAYTRPKRLCLHENGTLVTRRCSGSFLYGAEWLKFNDRCSENAYISEFTQYIYDVLTNFTLTVDSFRNITTSFQTLQNVSTLDISLLSDSLYESSNLASLGIDTDFISSVNSLFKIDKGVLKNSQIVLNSTDRILDSIDIFLDKKSFETNETHPSLLIQEENLVVFITKPVLSNLSGIVLYGNYSKSFLDYSIIEVPINETIEDLNEDDLELAVHVPENLFDSLTNNLTLEEKGNLSLIITLYNNDSIFNQDNQTSVSNSRIISVTIPGLGSYLEIPIPLIFRPNLKTFKGKAGCGFWYYGQTKKGKWSTTGGDYTETNNTIRCSYNHLTHFALLILTARTTTSDTEGIYVVVDGHLAYTLPLSIITVTGCTISLIGVLGIFITAVTFRRFREKLGTKILIQLSITIILEIILTQLAGLDNWLTKPSVCTTVGILLHYVVLSKFCWMFVIAVLQYLRFVKVLGAMPKKLFLKSILIGWIFPILPVLCTSFSSPDSYTAGIQNFCYPKDDSLYFGLLLPVALIITSNVLVFVMIMISISRSKAVQYDKSGHMLRRQTYLAILLFFMLGCPWIFGILAEMLRDVWFEIIFVYLFCLTATLQGFVLFAFYVVFDKETRLLWTNYIKSHI